MRQRHPCAQCPPHQLRLERERRNWTQGQLADAIYSLCSESELQEHGVIDKNMISKWERGLHVPHPFYREKLSHLFQKDAEALGLLSNSAPRERDIHPLQKARKRLGIKQKVLADLTGVSEPTIKRAERGDVLGDYTISAICAYFSQRLGRQVDRKELGLRAQWEDGSEEADASQEEMPANVVSFVAWKQAHALRA